MKRVTENGYALKRELYGRVELERDTRLVA